MVYPRALPETGWIDAEVARPAPALPYAGHAIRARPSIATSSKCEAFGEAPALAAERHEHGFDARNQAVKNEVFGEEGSRPPRRSAQL